MIDHDIWKIILNRAYFTTNLTQSLYFFFFIQVNESTDTQNKAILSVFIRYYLDGNID